MGVRVVTDNCCDLPEDLLKSHGISLVHMLVRFGDKEYEPGELTTAEFYQKMTSSTVLPTTTQPRVEEMLEVYNRALEDGSDVIAIHLSSGITGTVQSAQMVAEMIGNPRLHILDSRKASVGQGLLVLEAARMAERGEPLERIMARLEEMQKRMQCIFLVGNLEYLVKGGRVSRAKGLIAGVLDIKPVLYFDDEGFIMPFDKVRGHKAALKKLLDIMEKMGSNIGEQTVGVNHAACLDDAEYLQNEIKRRFGVKEVVIGEIGPVIGSHVGPGTFSVFFEA